MSARTTRVQGEAADRAEHPATRPAPAPIPFGLADLALLFQVSLWAGNYTVVKAVLLSMQPLAFNSLRMVVATLLFTAIAAVRRERLRWRRADLPMLTVCALLGHTVFQTCFAFGLARTTAGNTALILSLSPVVVGIISSRRREEELRLPAWIGAAASCLGVALLVGARGDAVTFGGEALLGDLAILVAAVAWAFYTVLSRPLLGHYSSLQFNTLTLFIGVPPLVMLALPELLTQRWTGLPADAWLGFGYATVLAFVVAYVIYSYGVQRLGPSRAAAYYNVTPPLAAFIAWAFGGETINLGFIAGAALILAGLYLVRRGTRLL